MMRAMRLVRVLAVTVLLAAALAWLAKGQLAGSPLAAAHRPLVAEAPWPAPADGRGPVASRWGSAPGSLSDERSLAAQQAPTVTVALHLPVVVNRLEAPWPVPSPSVATPTAPGPTTAVTATEGPTPVPRPTRTPTPTPESIDYPTSSGAIILQIGWSNADVAGSVWQEMEGTPWLTLYGDGRLIAGPKILDRMQLLYETQLSPRDVARWMDQLAYRVTFFRMMAAYDHPETTKPSLHVYGRISAGSWRVTLRGWEKWVRGPAPSIPGGGDAMRLVSFVKEREAEVAGHLSEPYLPEWGTILALELRPSIIPDAPQWPLPSIDVARIADEAPQTGPNPTQRLVGHRFVDAAVAAQVRAVIVPVADQYFPLDYRAAEFRASGRPIAVGLRQEVPGGSLFLPDSLREIWYRRDPTSGEPPYGWPGLAGSGNAAKLRLDLGSEAYGP